MFQHKPMTSPISPADSMASPTSDPSEVTDHYAILQLTPKATTDEIRAAYRRLRSVYFANDAKKYRALQAGFDCLMDPELRQVYDASYQPAAAAPSSLSSIGEVLDQGKHWRKDSAHGDDANAVIQEEEEEEEQDLRTDDPNWALKRFQFGHESLLGSEPYQSWIPLPTQSLPLCRQPKYIGNFAVNAWPN
jgi:curved DNA-binding protein CbpA